MPLNTWLKDGDASYIYEILLDERTRQRGYFSLDYVEKRWLHRQGKRDCQAQIWLLLNFELWNRLFIDATSTVGTE
jgi:asparagine synthase (glutamine-hydrolysing)